MIENGGLILFDDINPLPVKDARELYLGQNGFSDFQWFNAVAVPKVVALARKHGLPLLEAKVQDIFGFSCPTERARIERYSLASGGIYYGIEDMYLPCYTAMTSATILPDGRVFPCSYHREVAEGTEGKLCIGNIREKTMRQMQEDYFATLRLLPKLQHGEGLNPVCQRLCSPDLKRLNTGILRVLQRARVVG
jgi:hypothetical protein